MALQAALPAVALSGATLLLSLGFAALVLQRWRRARRPHQALWGAALLGFALASALELLAAAQGWGHLAYRAYFAITAVMVGLMAAGTAYLHSPRWGAALTAYVAVLAQALVVFGTFVPADAARLASASEQGQVPTRVLGGAGMLHAMVDIPAALVLIASPIASWRAGAPPAVLLIAAGAAVFTAVHSLASGAQTGALAVDSATLFGAGTLAGLVLMFAGYLAAGSARRPSERGEVPAPG